MKVISEYTIKKLIQAKLLENYKKKLLKEEDNSINEIDFQNQIISTGLIEALWVFLNDSEYTRDLGNIANFKPILNPKLEAILKSQNKAAFINNISDLPNILSDTLTALPDLLNETLFTKLIANSDSILQRFNSKIQEIKDKEAYIQKEDLYVIANHTTNNVKYNGFIGVGGIKNNIKEMISELLKKQPQDNITVNEVINKIKTLLPVLDANGSTNTTTDSTTQQNAAVNLQNTTPQQIKKVGFAELKDKLNLSSRQLQKLNRQITKIAEKRTNSKQNSDKYQALLVALTLKQMSGEQVNTNNAIADADAEQFAITTLKAEQTNFNGCYFRINYSGKKKIEKISGNNKIADEHQLLAYYISDGSELNVIPEPNYINTVDFFPKDKINKFVKHLTLQVDSILINSTVLKLNDDIKRDAQEFFKKVNDRNDHLNELLIFTDWIKSYFGEKDIKNTDTPIDYNFINYIQLKFLEYKNIESAGDALKKFTINHPITIMHKTVEIDDTATATTKKCFNENTDEHTDNFKLPALGVLKKNYYQQMAEYLLEPDFPSKVGFGFINKNDVEKNAYAKKLKDASLDADKIAEALKKLYPKAGDFKTEGNKEKWIANYYLNINVDEIIAAANDTSTSDPDAEETETDTAPTKDCLLRDNGNKYNFKLLSKEKMKELINKPKPASDDYRKVMAELLLDLDEVPTGYGFTDADKIKFKAALDTVNPKLTVDQIKNALADIYPKSANPRDPKNKEQWHPEYYININPHEIIKVAKKH